MTRSDRFRFICLVSLFVLLSHVVRGDEVSLSAKQREFFENRIRPVLVQHCYACHNSTDAAESGLMLDSREGTRVGGDNGRVLVPGKPDASRILATIRHEIEGLEMPDGGAKLDDSVIKDFQTWIEMGAPDPRDTPPSADELAEQTSWQRTLQQRKQWWSFRNIGETVPPTDPEIEETNAHPIDRFLTRTWNAKGIQPAEPADARTLIRRLYFNLIGLPPTPSELTRWEIRIRQDDSGRAIEALVDELLGSEHFGERWARHWMDWIRYAESHGSEGDPRLENAWIYRDYLIRALNADVPYNQLVREHIAGDLLQTPRIDAERGVNESLIATAHWRMVFHGFAPTDALEERVRFTDDQIDTFSKAFLGLTVSCARCHDHKFDAISQSDYYALYGILQSCRPGRVAIETPEQLDLHRRELSDLKQSIRKTAVAQWRRGLMQRLKRAVEKSAEVKTLSSPIDLLHGVKSRIAKGLDFETALASVLDELSARRPDNNRQTNTGYQKHWSMADRDDVDQWTRTGLGLKDAPSPPGAFAIAIDGSKVFDGIYPAGVYSQLISAKDAARLTSPDFDITQPTELWIRVFGNNKATARYVVQDYPRGGTVYPVSVLQPEWRWQRYDLTYWSGDRLHIELTTAQDGPTLTSNQARSGFGVTKVVLAKAGTFKPPESLSHLAPILTKLKSDTPENMSDLIKLVTSVIDESLMAWGQELSDDQAELIASLLGSSVLPNDLNALPDTRPLVDHYRRLESARPIPTRVPSLEEAGGSDFPLLIRGDHKRPAAPVARRFLEAIDDQPYQSLQSGRLELADDLIAEDNPLVRRVIVNRIWHHLFGRGLVSTPDNLGKLGSKPTHPELLDYLASEFAKDGWSIKRLIKTIVTTKAWQLSASPDPRQIELDPNNRWLARSRVRRLEAEAIRDTLLSVSGQLDRRMFGPAVAPSQPRRTIYTRVIRNSLDPFLRTFDFPEPSKTVGRRDVTNVPAQALAMMNNPQVAVFAQSLGDRVMRSEAASDHARVDLMYQITMGRLPTAREQEQIMLFVNESKETNRLNRTTRKRLETEIAKANDAIEQIERPVVERLKNNQTNQINQAISRPPRPLSAWMFADSMDDKNGTLDVSLRGDAERTDSGIRFSGNGFAVTEPIRQTLRSKTLEVWVRLENLTQRGGGVMTIQSIDGNVFDSIVYSELQPGEWLAGSNFHKRTKSLAGSVDQQAASQIIHLAVTYASDGTVTAYRNGRQYGRPYASDGPVEFSANMANVAFGVRHVPAGGNRNLSGIVERARLYDRALTPEEIEASYLSVGPSVSKAQISDAMTDRETDEHAKWVQTRDESQAQLDQIPDVAGPGHEWTELARSIFMTQEFLYLR